MVATTALTLVDGVRVVVEDTCDQITPYVLREQADWFEDEIRFVRRVLQPGGSAIDIGANHGVYALSMARAVGAGGRVHAFEPASATARLLEQSIALNGYAHLVLVRAALSDRAGHASLSLNVNSELNELIRGAVVEGPSEVVPLTTLDDCRDRYGWEHIDLLKIDAEGEEANILAGGRTFFEQLSPLVLYEIRTPTDLRLDLVQTFARLGYRSYRLASQPALLVPFDPTARPDTYLLNLFACKADRASLLEQRGLLSSVAAPGVATLRAAPLAPPAPRPAAGEWRAALAPYPYATLLMAGWERTMAQGRSDDVGLAVALYARSRDGGRSPLARLQDLQASVSRLLAASERASTCLRLSSLARAAADLGERELAVASLQRLLGELSSGKPFDPDEPFLLPLARFDTVAPRGSLGDWLVAAAAEQCVHLGSHSSFFAPGGGIPLLELIHTLGYAGEDMTRRLELARRRFALHRPRIH